MSKELTELGQELCTEFDERKKILRKLEVEIHSNIQNQLEELRRQVTFDASERWRTKLQLQTNVKSLLINYSQEDCSIKRSLREDKVGQTRELRSWIEKSRNQLNAWHKAVRYTHTGW